MKVVLVNCLSFGGSNFEPPIGITMIGGYLKSKKVDVRIIDAEILKWDNKRVEAELKKIKPDILGVTSITYNRFEALDLLERAKKLGIMTVYGGVHATFLSSELMKKYSFIDVIVMGEGEKTMYEICTGKKLESINGIIYKKGEQVKVNPNGEFIKNINVLPYGWDLLPMSKYKYYGIFASRGCPFNCTFCASPKLWNRRLRVRDAKKVIDEIEYLINKYGKKRVHIKDDTFTARKEWATEVCNEIIKRGLDIKWECLGRVDTVDLPLLKKLKEAGCELIEYGVESGNNKILKSINKMITRKQVINAINLTKEAKLDYAAFFIIGHPGETIMTMNDTFDLAWEIRPFSLSFCPLDVFPGSKVYDVAVENGLLEDFSWDNKSYVNMQGQKVPRFENPNINEAVLEEYSKRFYMRYAFYNLMNINRTSLIYLFKNEYVPYHFLIKDLKSLCLIIEEFNNALYTKGGLLKKFFGFLILPFFISRILFNYLKVFIKKLKTIL